MVLLKVKRHLIFEKSKNIIWLDCNIDIIYSRINDDPHRPNANNKTIKQLNDLYCSRILRYNEIAFKKFDSHLLSISEIYYELLNLIKGAISIRENRALRLYRRRCK